MSVKLNVALLVAFRALACPLLATIRFQLSLAWPSKRVSKWMSTRVNDGAGLGILIVLLIAFVPFWIEAPALRNVVLENEITFALIALSLLVVSGSFFEAGPSPSARMSQLQKRRGDRQSCRASNHEIRPGRALPGGG